MFSSQDLLQAVQASQVPFAVFKTFSGDYSFIYNNKAYLSLFRLDENKIAGKSITVAFKSPFVPENTQFLSHILQSMDKVLETRLPDRLVNIPINLLNDDGSKIEQHLADIENTPVIRNGSVESVSQSIFLKSTSQEPDLYTDFRIHPSHAAEIARTRNELQKILESSLDVICTIDSDGCFLTVSAAAQKIWGYSPNELTGRRYMDLVYEADKSITIGASRSIMGGTDMTNFENRYVRKDGTLVSMVWSARWDNADQTMYCIAKDATEKKLAEENLIKNEKRYRSLVENGADAVVIFDQSAKAKYVSPSITRVLGYTEEEAMAIDLNDLLHPSDRLAVTQKIYEIVKRPGETIEGHTARIKHKNGSWRWIEATLTNMIQDPMINGIVDNFRDVTVRKEVELEKNLLLDNTEESFILLNTELNIVTYNRQFEELYQTCFNVSIEKGASILLYAQPERREMVAELYKKVLQGESIVSEFKVLDPRTKEKRIFQLKYKPAKGTLGEIIGGFVTATDITDKQLVLNRLIESEEKYKLLFQSSPLPKFVYDLATFQILDVNDRAIAHYSYTQEEFLERSILDIWSEDEHKRVIELHENIRTSDAPLKFGIHVHRKKNGGLIKSEVSGYKFDYAGRQCVMAIYNDVTEREKALQRIKENEVKLLASQKIAKLGYWQSFPDKRGLYWSDEVYNIWEVEKHNFQLDYDSHFNTIHPDDREEFLRSRDKAFTEGAQHDVEHRIILPDGSIKWVHALGNLIRNEKGNVVIFEGTVQDITKEKISLDKLAQSNARYENVMRATSDAIWDWDLKSGQVYWGKGFETLFGYSLEELNSWKTFWGDNVHPEDRKRVFSDVRNIIRGKNETWTQEYRFRKANGKYAFVVDKGILIKDNLSAPVKMVGAIQDVSQLKELNSVLENNVRDLAISNRELEQFAYVASHDLQEPLRMISSFLTQLQRKYSDQLDSKANQYIDFAVDGAKRMRQIILDLLDFSRVGRVDTEIQSVSLNEVINDILILYRKRTEETNALFIISDMPSIYVPKASIRQLFQNLISNALKYQAPQNSPLIEIGFVEDSDHWQFWVKDNGIGISPEYFDKVFIIFQRLHTKDQYSGTGMGLAICRKIAENLGGKLWIESEEGKGSTFYFTVPKVSQ